MDALVSRFIESFTKAIRLEMEAMKQRLGSFEIQLSSGEMLTDSPASTTARNRKRYAFAIYQRDGKLIPGVDCTFRCDGPDVLVTVVGVDNNRVVLESPTVLDLTASRKMLVIYPWFLYERLIDSLERVAEDTTLFPEFAMKAFGKLDIGVLDDSSDRKLHPSTLASLNQGQIDAVRLCLCSDLSFIWGPPGTGKTTTLASILSELASLNDRILVASTTNAAVDQVAATLIESGDLSREIDEGAILRVGDCGAEARACSLDMVRKKLRSVRKEKTDEAHRVAETLDARVNGLDALLKRVRMEGEGGQFELFKPAADDGDFIDEFRRLLGDEGPAIAASIDREDVLVENIATARAELAITRGNILALRSKSDPTESEVIERARIVLTTMANLYVSEKLQGERFDTVILEEAGMAVLPAVFYCAALASKRLACIGDPRQLPPIVQSDAEYVRKAMGRSIFEVTVPDGADEPGVALLSRQYRMHPHISSIVSEVFYDGKLEDDPRTAQRGDIAKGEPFPGHVVAVADLGGSSACVRAEGSGSRVNEESARRAVAFAIEAERSGMQSVGIITPYVAQARRIRELAADQKTSSIECSTVHRFQGHESDCIIFDFTDAAPMDPGVLLVGDGFERQSANLLNVSISRARGKLILLAEVAYFASFPSCGTVNRILAAASRL
jgi:hypothetical protein